LPKKGHDRSSVNVTNEALLSVEGHSPGDPEGIRVLPPRKREKNAVVAPRREGKKKGGGSYRPESRETRD